VPLLWQSGCRGDIPPDKTGFPMGAFHFFIVIPQIMMSVFLGTMIVKLSGGNQLAPVLVGGDCPFDRSGVHAPC